MVIIRLARGGSKKKPFYQIVVTDKRNPRDGRFIEKLGFFNPLANNNTKILKINLIKINQWLKQGATISTKVSFLIKKAKKNINI